MASKRGNPVAKIGNYMQEVDSTGAGKAGSGMDADMEGMMFGSKLDKTENSYLTGAANKGSAREAIRRARKANKQKPPQFPE